MSQEQLEKFKDADESIALAPEVKAPPVGANKCRVRTITWFQFYKNGKPVKPFYEDSVDEFWVGVRMEGLVASLSGASRNHLQAGYWDLWKWQHGDLHFERMVITGIVGMFLECDQLWCGGTEPILWVHTKKYAYALQNPVEEYANIWRAIVKDWSKHHGGISAGFTMVDPSLPKPKWWHLARDWNYLLERHLLASEAEEELSDHAGDDVVTDTQPSSSKSKKTSKGKAPATSGNAAGPVVDNSTTKGKGKGKARASQVDEGEKSTTTERSSARQARTRKSVGVSAAAGDDAVGDERPAKKPRTASTSARVSSVAGPGPSSTKASLSKPALAAPPTSRARASASSARQRPQCAAARCSDDASATINDKGPMPERQAQMGSSRRSTATNSTLPAPLSTATRDWAKRRASAVRRARAPTLVADDMPVDSGEVDDAEDEAGVNAPVGAPTPPSQDTLVPAADDEADNQSPWPLTQIPRMTPSQSTVDGVNGSTAGEGYKADMSMSSHDEGVAATTRASTPVVAPAPLPVTSVPAAAPEASVPSVSIAAPASPASPASPPPLPLSPVDSPVAGPVGGPSSVRRHRDAQIVGDARRAVSVAWEAIRRAQDFMRSNGAIPPPVTPDMVAIPDSPPAIYIDLDTPSAGPASPAPTIVASSSVGAIPTASSHAQASTSSADAHVDRGDSSQTLHNQPRHAARTPAQHGAGGSSSAIRAGRDLSPIRISSPTPEDDELRMRMADTELETRSARPVMRRQVD